MSIEAPRLSFRKASSVDDVTKYVFDLEGQAVEYVGLTNHGGKDVVCVPSQSGCRMGCKFCHLTARPKQTVRAVDPVLSAAAVRHVVADRGRPETNRTLLISFMGMGEPLLDPEAVGWLAGYVQTDHREIYDKVRFGLATIVPKVELLRDLTSVVLERELDLKLHWSLHHPDSEQRAKLMPGAEDLYKAATAVNFYRESTGNDVEVHYTLFDGNDDDWSCRVLISILQAYDFPIKFLRFSERPDKAVCAITEERRRAFVDRVRQAGVRTEEYTPPGADILGACGEFEPF